MGQANDAFPLTGYGSVTDADAVGTGGGLHKGLAVTDDQPIQFSIPRRDIHNRITGQRVLAKDSPLHLHGDGASLLTEQEKAKSNDRNDQEQSGYEDDIVAPLSDVLFLLIPTPVIRDRRGDVVILIHEIIQ